MQSNKTCTIVEQYLAYLITVKGRSQNTISEYRLDLLQFFRLLQIQKDLSAPTLALQSWNSSNPYNSPIFMPSWLIAK
ncbi:site-specific integrase [Anaerotignum propionicum]|uniref:site-specific integrase n=1 Tax=Anaerotignum propionicum TaxID=28446 RepID=UPI0009340965|nr:site-specific integrase [Anaerotignum propionicum]